MKNVVRIVILSVFAFCLSIACKNYTEDIEDYLSYWSAGVSITEYRFEPQPQIYTEGMQCVSSKAPVTVTFTVHNSKNLNLKMPGDSDAPADIISFPHIPDAPDKRVAAPQSGNDYEFKKISNTELKLTYNPVFLQKYEWGRGDITPSIILYTTDGRVFKQNIPFKLNVNTPPPAIAECVIGQTETAPPSETCYYEKFDGKSDVCIDNEIPFELPANWQWQRGKEIFCPMTTKIPSGHNFRYIDIDAIDNKSHRIRCSKLIEVSKAPSRASREVQNGDILFSLVRPYLKNIALVLENYSDCIASTGFYVCRPNKTLISKYAFYMMTSQYVVNGLNKFMKGDNSPSITGDNIIKWLYPLPPVSEQKRIVTRIGEIFNVLDDIQRDLI